MIEEITSSNFPFNSFSSIASNNFAVSLKHVVSSKLFVIQNNIDISDQGLVSLNSNVYKYQTSNPKFFAGGDMIIGSSLAVHAIAHGRDAAKEIINY